MNTTPDSLVQEEGEKMQPKQIKDQKAETQEITYEALPAKYFPKAKTPALPTGDIHS